MGVKLQEAVNGTIFFSIWDIALYTPECCLALTPNDLQNKDSIFCIEYEGQHWASVAMFEIPRFVLGTVSCILQIICTEYMGNRFLT